MIQNPGYETWNVFSDVFTSMALKNVCMHPTSNHTLIDIRDDSIPDCQLTLITHYIDNECDGV